MATIIPFKKNQNNGEKCQEQSTKLECSKKSHLTEKGFNERTVKFEEISGLTEAESAALVEIGDENLLARINNVIPGTLQAVANTRVIHGYERDVKSLGQLYQAIIPKGAVLDKSRDLPGAFRSTYREGNKIKGQANLAPVGISTDKLARTVNIDAVMNVLSIVVGQHYMTKINSQLKNISVHIEKIADFQQTEFQSKVVGLIEAVQKICCFKAEIIENNELRNRELSHLDKLADECNQLLIQSDSSLCAIIKQDQLRKYKIYEQKTVQVGMWWRYQHILLDVMYEIARLQYVLNLGEASIEYCCYLYNQREKQSNDTQNKLHDWHKQQCETFDISIRREGRKRKVLVPLPAALVPIPFDITYYKKISPEILNLIKQQIDGIKINKIEIDDLFEGSIRLVAKSGRLYYLPQIG